MDRFELEIDITRMDGDGAKLAAVLRRLADSIEGDNLRIGDSTRVRDDAGTVVGVASLTSEHSRPVRMATTRTV